jgi:hypothetical protein
MEPPDARSDVPQWHVVGDWFDVCRCDLPCPCEFAQAPTDNYCEGVLAWHVREGHYGDVRLDGLSLSRWALSRAMRGLEKPRWRWGCSSTNGPVSSSARHFR